MMLINIWLNKREIEKQLNMKLGLPKKLKRLNSLTITISCLKTKPLKPVCLHLIELSHITSRVSIKVKSIKLTWKEKCKFEKNNRWMLKQRMSKKLMLCNLKL